MDTRAKNKLYTPTEEPKTSLKEIDDDQFIIRSDKINTDESFIEATIYNLVKRFENLDYLEQKYEQELATHEVTPKFLKHYVHSNCRILTILFNS